MRSSSAVLLLFLAATPSVSASNIRGAASEQDEDELSHRDLGLFDNQEDEVYVNLEPDDTPLVAKKLGISLANAKKLIGNNEAFSKLLEEMHVQDDEDFLQSEMPSTPEGDYIIKYKNGKVPPRRSK